VPGLATSATATAAASENCNGALTEALLARPWDGRDRWLSDGGGRGGGRLIAKSARNGVVFYFVWFDAAGRRRFRRIGRHVADGAVPDDRDTVDLGGARRTAAALAERLRRGDHDGLSDRNSTEPAGPALVATARPPTLADILDAHVRALGAAGRPSANDVRRLVRRHVLDAWPAVARTPVDALGPGDLAPMLARLVALGHPRTAAKLRSALRSAFARRHDRAVDPAAALAPVATQAAARRAVPGPLALAAWMERVRALDAGPERMVLALMPRLAGARLADLLALRRADVDLVARTVTLPAPRSGDRDRKRTPSVVPLTRRTAWLLVQWMHRQGLDQPDAWLFATPAERLQRARAVTATCARIVRHMRRKGECDAPFGVREVRRACDVMLGALGADASLRAGLQGRSAPDGAPVGAADDATLASRRALMERFEKRLATIASGRARRA
jgi:integrase